MRLAVFAVVFVCALGAGTAWAQPENPAFEAARARVSEECGRGTPSSASQLLSAKLAAVTGVSPDLDMLSNRDTPTEAERQALRELAAQRDRCRSDFAEVHQEYGYAPAASILRASHPALRAVYADLYAGTITYGEANRRFDAIGTRVREAIAEYGRGLDAQAAADARQGAIDAAEALQQMQRSRAPTYQPPQQTLCSRVGTQIHCTTR